MADFPYLSVNQAADILGVTAARVKQLLIAGTLRGQKLGVGPWAIHRKEVARFKKRAPSKRGRPRGSKSVAKT